MTKKRYALFAFILLFFTSQFRPTLACPEDNLRKKLDSYILTAVKAGITIEHLLEHTAGLHEYHDTRGDFEEMDREKAVKTILSQKLRFDPGDRKAYPNSGYALLAVIIELVSGQSYESFLKEYLFKPAGMNRTGFYRDPLWKEDEAAVGYEGKKIGKKNSPYYWPQMTWALVGGGGMISSVSDLYKWIQALEADKILSKKAKDKMYDPLGRPMAYAGGNDFGFSAVVFEYPKEMNYIIVATNAHNNISAPSLGEQISLILKGKEPQEIKPEEHLSVFKKIQDETGEIELLGAKKTSEFKAELLIQSKNSGQKLRISFEVEAEEPHRISGLSFKQEQE